MFICIYHRLFLILFILLVLLTAVSLSAPTPPLTLDDENLSVPLSPALHPRAVAGKFPQIGNTCKWNDVICAQAGMKGIRQKYDDNEAAMHRDKGVWAGKVTDWGDQIKAFDKKNNVKVDSSIRVDSSLSADLSKQRGKLFNRLDWTIRYGNHVTQGYMNNIRKIQREQNAYKWIIKRELR